MTGSVFDTAPFLFQEVETEDEEQEERDKNRGDRRDIFRERGWWGGLLFAGASRGGYGRDMGFLERCQREKGGYV